MCGFAGFVSFGPDRRPGAERGGILRAMGRQLARRGPDDETLFDDGTLALVFRRLSIVDVEGGWQPIWNEGKSAFVAVNGEIYNHLELRGDLAPRHAFSTRSDSEVALHLWEDRGPGFLRLLNGMFAIALWDARERRLLLARDRLGIKPLYYARTKDGLLFGSELKALLAHPDCPTELNLADFDLSYIDGPTYFPVTPGRQPTYVKGVEFLPAGHHLNGDLFLTQIQGLGAVPIWFVHWDDLQAAASDGVLTIEELEALDPRIGTADFFEEQNHVYGVHPVSHLAFEATGTLEDGSSFEVRAVEVALELKKVQIDLE